MQQQANKLAIQAELNNLSNTLATEQVQLQRAQASLQQEIAENRNRKATNIIANQNGTITTITSQIGQMMNGGQTMATLIPNNQTQDNSDQLEAHLYAPSRTTGFVAIGQEVLIRYSAFPYQKFGLQKGKVIAVSSTPFAPNELPPNLASTILSNAQQNIQGFNSNEALYRIKVKLDKQAIDTYGQMQSIKPGMTLEADILQDRRKIWEWVIEPALAVMNR